MQQVTKPRNSKQNLPVHSPSLYRVFFILIIFQYDFAAYLFIIFSRRLGKEVI